MIARKKPIGGYGQKAVVTGAVAQVDHFCILKGHCGSLSDCLLEFRVESCDRAPAIRCTYHYVIATTDT